jgi:hypothetical protein
MSSVFEETVRVFGTGQRSERERWKDSEVDNVRNKETSCLTECEHSFLFLSINATGPIALHTINQILDMARQSR